MARRERAPWQRRQPRQDVALLAVAGAALVLWAVVCVPTLAGARTFFFRDVFTTHLPLKALGAAELRAGRIPAFEPAWGLGQPFRGNPNALPFYPGNLFYLLLPFWSAFNLHYALHWLLAAIAMAALARGLGQGRCASLVAALTYGGSGWMLSALTFYNLLAVAAWWPLAMLGAARGGRRGLALGGAACGLALLGGEPVAAALGVLPLLVAASFTRPAEPAGLSPATSGGSETARRPPGGTRRGVSRGLLLKAAAVLGLGLAIALPQLVATLRVLPFTYRGAHGMTPEQAAGYALHPLRLLELLVPFPFGRPGTIGRQGVWAVSVLPALPLILSLYSGIVGLWLALAAARRRAAWALLAGAGLLLAIAGGAAGELLARASFGLFRFPEKFLLWPALALPLLAGWGTEEVTAAGGRAWRRLAALGGGLLLGLACLLRLGSSTVIAAATAGLARLALQQRLAALDLLAGQLTAWTLALLAGGAALLAAAWVARRRWRPLLAALQLGLLLQLLPLAATDDTAPYRRPSPWARLLASRLGHPPAVAHELLTVPHWRDDPSYTLPPGSRAAVERFKAFDLAAAPGALYGLSYPLAPDLEGMQSRLFTPMLAGLPAMSWEARARWLRATGVEAVVLFEDPEVPDLQPLASATHHGVASHLFAVPGSAPAVWWPRRLLLAPTTEEALRLVSGGAGAAAFTAALPSSSRPPGAPSLSPPLPPLQALLAPPLAEVAVPLALPHDALGSARLLASSPDHVELEAESAGGGVVVLRRAFQPLYHAEAEGRRLLTLPVNLNLLGIRVPPGRHQVSVTVSAWPEELAAAVALLALGAALGVAATAARARPSASSSGHAGAMERDGPRGQMAAEKFR